MKLRILSILAVIGVVQALSACTTTGEPDPTIPSVEPTALTKAQKDAVITGLKASLKDPTSPLFGDMKAAVGTDGNTYVCGYVNAKNSFGGYVGDKPFMGSLLKGGTPFVVEAMGGTDEDTYIANQMCTKYGLAEPY